MRLAGLYFGAEWRPKKPVCNDGRAKAGNTSITCSPAVAVRAASGSTAALIPSRNGQIGAASQNMPTLPRLAGCTPPPSQLTRVAATRSTGRMLVGFFTTVGWSRARMVTPSGDRTCSMKPAASSKCASRGASNETAVFPSNAAAQIAPGVRSVHAESKPMRTSTMCRLTPTVTNDDLIRHRLPLSCG